jgi:BolA protein
MTATRTELIHQAITAALKPAVLEIEDESHLHAGHAGAKSGLGHFHVRVISAQFEGVSKLRRHQLVYKAVGSLMQTDIHALRMETLTPDETT